METTSDGSPPEGTSETDLHFGQRIFFPANLSSTFSFCPHSQLKVIIGTRSLVEVYSLRRFTFEGGLCRGEIYGPPIYRDGKASHALIATGTQFWHIKSHCGGVSGFDVLIRLFGGVGMVRDDEVVVTEFGGEGGDPCGVGFAFVLIVETLFELCLLYTSPSPRD